MHTSRDTDDVCLQEFYTLRAEPEKSKPAKASEWDAMLQSAAPPYGATCMDFHKVWQAACFLRHGFSCFARVADMCLACSAPATHESRAGHSPNKLA